MGCKNKKNFLVRKLAQEKKKTLRKSRKKRATQGIECDDSVPPSPAVNVRIFFIAFTCEHNNIYYIHVIYNDSYWFS